MINIAKITALKQLNYLIVYIIFEIYKNDLHP